VIGWMCELTVDSIDPNRFGRFSSDSGVKIGTKPVVFMRDEERSVVAGGDLHGWGTVSSPKPGQFGSN
jgi:hypothetical protein